MAALTLTGHSGIPLTIDECAACRAFWFDSYEMLQVSPESTLTLFKRMGDSGAEARPLNNPALSCPRCALPLIKTHDHQHATPFEYWKCDNGHGRFMTFLNFVREKSFVEPMVTNELADLRRKMRLVSCKNCGGPIDILSDPVCPHCGSPFSI